MRKNEVKNLSRLPVALICLPIFLLTLEGCSSSTGAVIMPDQSKQVIEQKIKSIESSDLPAPVKEKALAELRARK